MSNKVKLGELLEVKRGVSLSGEFYSETGEKIRLTLGNFDYPNGGFKNNISKTDIYFTGKVKPEFILKKGDIITPLTEQVSGLLGETARIPEDNLYIQSGDIGLVVPNSELLDNSFAYYLLPSPAVKKQLGAGAQQTKIRHTSPKKIKDCEVWIPEMPCQKFIGALLDSINAKISTNNCINAELESMAKTIYDYWFTQFDFPDENGKPYRSSGDAMVWNAELKRNIPKGWSVQSLSKIASLQPKSVSPIVGTKYHHYSIPSFDESKCPTLEDGNNIASNKYIVPNNCVLVSKLNPQFKRIWLINNSEDNSICSTEFLPIKAAKTGVYVLYSLLNSAAFSIHLIQNATSSTGSRKRIDPDNCMSYKFPYNEDVFERFNRLIQPLLTRICVISTETQTLSAFRDWLLPILMNGQVSFKDEQDEQLQINDSGFEQWLTNQGFAARGDVDMEVLRNIYEAMDSNDK